MLCKDYTPVAVPGIFLADGAAASSADRCHSLRSLDSATGSAPIAPPPARLRRPTSLREGGFIAELLRCIGNHWSTHRTVLYLEGQKFQFFKMVLVTSRTYRAKESNHCSFQKTAKGDLHSFGKGTVLRSKLCCKSN